MTNSEILRARLEGTFKPSDDEDVASDAIDYAEKLETEISMDQIYKDMQSARYAVQWLTEALEYVAQHHPRCSEDPVVLEYMRRAAEAEPHPRCAENDTHRNNRR